MRPWAAQHVLHTVCARAHDHVLRALIVRCVHVLCSLIRFIPLTRSDARRVLFQPLISKMGLAIQQNPGQRIVLGARLCNSNEVVVQLCAKPVRIIRAI
jgi:hypothetical protein